MWDELGFSDSPYDVKPLAIAKEDALLLVGRKSEAIEFSTSLGMYGGGALILSGKPGVGKTSFLNVQQFNLVADKDPQNARILPSYKFYPVQPEDKAKEVCLGCLEILVNSIEREFSLAGRNKLPHNTQRIRDWVLGSNKVTQVSIMVAGFGGGLNRNVDTPSLKDASTNFVCDLISTVVSECKTELGKKYILCTIDNIDNLPEADIISLFVSLRDTLFTIDGLWVVLIGQSGLLGLIRSNEPKAAERISGYIELNPLEIGELLSAIDERVKRFSKVEGATAPISEKTHKMIYESSDGEIRFTFQICNQICRMFVSDIINKFKNDDTLPENVILSDLMKEQLVRRVIPDNTAEVYIEKIIKDELQGLGLTKTEANILERICRKGDVTYSDYKECGSKGQRAFRDHCARFTELRLLSKRHAANRTRFKPSGLVALAHTIGLDLTGS